MTLTSTSTAELPDPTDTTKPRIDASEVRRLFRQAVKVYGADRIGASAFALYPTETANGGQYRAPWARQPQEELEVSCIVGAVYHFLGVPLNLLPSMPFPKNAYAGCRSVNEHPKCPAYFTDEAEELLKQGMLLNDARIPWGDIVSMLDGRVPSA